MIEPTVGRIVWYHAGANDFPGTDGGDQPLAAIIAHVWSETCVNLAVFTANGRAESRTSVLLVQEEQERPGAGPFCEWMGET